jgi:hypothetical protein
MSGLGTCLGLRTWLPLSPFAATYRQIGFVLPNRLAFRPIHGTASTHRSQDHIAGCDYQDHPYETYLFSLYFAQYYLPPDFPKLREAALCIRPAWLPFGTTPPLDRATEPWTRDASFGLVIFEPAPLFVALVIIFLLCEGS